MRPSGQPEITVRAHRRFRTPARLRQLDNLSRLVLEESAKGYTFEEILLRNPHLNLHDIFRALSFLP